MIAGGSHYCDIRLVVLSMLPAVGEVNNAGIATQFPYNVTVDGIETTFQAQWFSARLLQSEWVSVPMADADMWPQTWRHKASDMFDSKVCSAGELFESFFADEASLTFAPTESWQSSGASHIWCSSCCTSWGCAIDLGRQTAQTVPKSDDLWWFCRKSFCLRRFFQNKKMFQLLMVDLSLPNPDPNLASGPFELPGSLLFSKTCVCVCVSFWSKNAGINDKNLGPYVSVLQRKWHCTIASKSHHRISQKFHVHGSMPSHAIIWIVHNNANRIIRICPYISCMPFVSWNSCNVSTFRFAMAWPSWQLSFWPRKSTGV